MDEMSELTRGAATDDARDDRPWWRYGMVWLVIGGPAVVVVAGIATAVIAVRGADPVITDVPAAMTRGATAPTALTPAMQARNHAATARP
jgi:hypothetical protein